MSHRHCWTKRREDQHPLHLRQKILRSPGIGKNLVVLHSTVFVYVGFNHQGLGVDRAHCAERALLQFRPSIQHERHVFSVVRLQLPRNRQDRRHQAENQHGARQSRGRRHHECVQRIFQPYSQALVWPPRLRSFPRNRQTQLQPQIRRFFRTAHAHQQLLRVSQGRVLPQTCRASVQMLAQALHLGSCHRSVQIRRQQPIRLRTFHGHIPHGITSTLLPPPATCRGIATTLSSSGMVSPSSPPTSCTYAASRCFSACRPRVNLDFTVPSEICKISAISSYDISSRSRRIRVVR